MTVTVCPAAIIDAPIERVWSLLMDPHEVGEWSEARLDAAVPEGRLQVGQHLRFSATALGKRWPVLWTVTGLVPDRHSLDVHISLPLGMVNQEHISLTEAAGGKTFVQFG